MMMMMMIMMMMIKTTSLAISGTYLISILVEAGIQI
jgi:hypothetical protein